MSPVDPSDDERRTVMWKISNMIFGNSALVDDQRYSRLQACRQLEKAWKNCEHRRRKRPMNLDPSTDGTTAASSMSPDETTRIQDLRTGLKISRFYNWGLSHNLKESTLEAMRSTEEGMARHGIARGLLGVGTENMHDTVTRSTAGTISPQQQRSSQPTCNREIHAVWACRALSLGCGADLVQLKKCFQSKENENGLDPTCHYHLQHSPPDETGKDCSLYQTRVAKCVTQTWNKMEQRRSP